MKRATFNILFFIKKKKMLRSGEAPIYMRITINSEQSEVSIKRSIDPKFWDVPRNKAKGNSDETAQLNDYLSSIRSQIYDIHKNLQDQAKPINPKAILNCFTGNGEKQWKLLELFTDHNKQMQELVGKDFAPLTLQRYQIAHKHIEKFMKQYYNNTQLNLSEVDHKFVSQFEHYLKVDCNCQHNSAMKHVKALKKIINQALANDYIRKDPFANYKITQKNVTRECLTQLELNKIIEKEISIQRLDIIRDLFLVQCYTGLAYKDLSELTRDHIQIGIDGFKWIVMDRFKTGVNFRVPILPIVENIFSKYADDLSCKIKNTLLPVPSNQKMNSYLKEIGTICEINKELHTHLARHTYATTVTLSNGIPIETVSKLLGHTKIQTTQIYAKVSESKISEEFTNLRKMAL